MTTKGNFLEFTDEELKDLFSRVDTNDDQKVSIKEFRKMLKKEGITISESEIKERFTDVGGNASMFKKSKIDFDQFCELARKLEYRKEIIDLYNEINDGEPLTVDVLAKWIRKTQNIEKGKKQAKEIIKELCGAAADSLDLESFHRYIGSAKFNSPVNPRCSEVYQPMDLPLAHYYIASSHNTYLLGDQLKGKSSVEAYRMALRRGCRCVELDCWDPVEGDEPIIYHGHTLTSKILFKDVIQCIKESGFDSTPYPVIISIENHCKRKYQRIMAKHLKEILGDMLPPSFIGEDMDDLPSPEELKRKVLIKAKTTGVADDAPDESEEEDKPAIGPDGKPKKPAKVSKSLAALVHLKAIHFHSVKDKHAVYEMSSFSERKLKKLIKKDHDGYVKYHTRQIARVYPGAHRVGSSNYNCVPAWVAGAQIVALNYQTGDKSMWFNEALFEDNGKSGYVTKPPHLIHLNEKPEKKTLRVKVISSFKLPTSTVEVPDPFVKVEIRGESEDCKKERTKVSDNTPYHAIFNSEFEFEITCPETAFLLMHVYDEDVGRDDFLGQMAVRVSLLRPGIHTWGLKKPTGERQGHASLLVDIQWD